MKFTSAGLGWISIILVFVVKTMSVLSLTEDLVDSSSADPGTLVEVELETRGSNRKCAHESPDNFQLG